MPKTTAWSKRFLWLAIAVLANACGGPSSPSPGPGPLQPPIIGSCLVSVPANQVSPPASHEGESRTLDVIASADCDWTAESRTDFIAITGSDGGRGNGTLTVRVDANTGAQRSGTVVINALTVAITQAGVPCRFAVNPTTHGFGAEGGVGSIDVTVTQGADCTWTATSNASFITVTGAGTGTATFSVAPNSGDPRTGTLTIAGQTVTVRQDSAAAPPPPPPPPLSRCDVNRDSRVDSVDVDLVQQAALAGSTDSTYDINRDGRVNVIDIQLVVNAISNPSSCPR